MLTGLLTGYSSSSEDEEEQYKNSRGDEFQEVTVVPEDYTRLNGSIPGTDIAKVLTQPLPKRKRKDNKKNGRKRIKSNDPESMEFDGPWAKGIDSSDEDEYREITDGDELEDTDDEPQHKDQSTLRVTTELYEDIRFMNPPTDYMNDIGRVTCSTPTKVRRTFKGHQGGVTNMQFFPQTGHLLLSCGNDGNVYLWDMCRQNKLLRGYYGHSQAVKSVVFDSTGRTFLSCSFDRTLNLWDTETGQILKTLQFSAVPNTAIFNPNNESEIIVGLANKRIEHFDLSQASFQQPVQAYDHHLGAINSLTVVDEGKRFMSTSDDRTVRIWRWHINIPDKIIADPTQHSMPCTVVHPIDSFIALQTMDNSIKVIQGKGKFRYIKKKRFEGHRVAGYGIQIDCTPDGQIIMSGDANGFVFFWSWNLGKLLKKLKISNSYVSCIKKHPRHPSGVVAAGESGDIVYCQ